MQTLVKYSSNQKTLEQNEKAVIEKKSGKVSLPVSAFATQKEVKPGDVACQSISLEKKIVTDATPEKSSL